MEFSHKSVLLNEAVEALAIRPDGIYVDGTAGGGGHSFAIASRLEGGKLIAIELKYGANDQFTRHLEVFRSDIPRTSN